jgi:integral membrane protein (TIGR01906 family)
VNPALGRIRSVLVGVATGLVIVTVAIAPFLTAPWLAFEQDRAQVPAWTGFSATEVATVTNAIVADLVVGPPDFDVQVAGEPVLNDRERGHMRDVRTVFLGLWGLTAIGAVVLVLAARSDRAAFWRGVTRGATVLAVGVVGIGAVALVAFDALFETFHRIFFPGGTYTFDPAEERLVQLFPFQFWQESAIAAGIVIVIVAVGVRVVAAGRGRATNRAPAPAAHPEPVA